MAANSQLRNQDAVHDNLAVVGPGRHEECLFNSSVAWQEILLDDDQVVDITEQRNHSRDLTEDDPAFGGCAKVGESDAIAIDQEPGSGRTSHNLNASGPVTAGNNVVVHECQSGKGSKCVSQTGWATTENSTQLSTVADCKLVAGCSVFQ